MSSPVCVCLCLCCVTYFAYMSMLIQSGFLGKGRVTYFTGICLLVPLCLSKVDFWEKEASHISQEYVFYLCVFAYVYKGGVKFDFILCVFAYENFGGKGGVTYFTGIWLLLSCVRSPMSYPKLIFGKRRSHIFHRNMASILCVFPNAYA